MEATFFKKAKDPSVSKLYEFFFLKWSIDLYNNNNIAFFPKQVGVG